MKRTGTLRLVARFGGFLLMAGFLSQRTAYAAADVWQWLNPYPTGNLLNGVSFLNGQFIACSESQLLKSQDGTNWTTYAAPGDVSLSRVAFGGGLYVAVGYKAGSGAIVTSSNLMDWTLQTSGTTNALQTVIYGNGLFVATGNGGTILTSANGSSWETRASGTSNALISIAFGNGTYVALSSNSAASVSSDGISWTRINIGPQFLSTVNYSKGLFHAGGSRFPNGIAYGALYTSSDGTNWSGELGASLVPIRTVFADTNRFYFENGIGTVSGTGMSVSEDGTYFSAVTTTNLVFANPPSGYAYGNGLFVGAGRAIQVSPNVTNWNTVTGPVNNLTDIAYGNNAYVAVGGGFSQGVGGTITGSILRSSHGTRFEAQASPVTAPLSRVLFANGVFHSVGYSGTILRSTNGIQWTQRTSGTGNFLHSLCYGNSLWMATGANGTIVTSPNGLAWTLRTSGTGSALYGVTTGTNMFVAVGAGGTIVTSPDASNWSVQFADTLDTFFDITYGNGQFVAVGANGSIWLSPDGVNWNAGTSGTSNRLLAVTFNDGRFIAAGCPDDLGNQNVLLISTNGSAWAALDPGTSYRLYGARFLNHAFLITGVNGTILQNASLETIQLDGKWNSVAGQFELSMGGGLGQSFVVQSKDSVGAATWNNRLTVSNAPSPFSFTDPTSASQSSRFYRVVAP